MDLIKRAKAAQQQQRPSINDRNMTPTAAETVDISQIIARLLQRLNDNQQERDDISKTLSNHNLIRSRQEISNIATTTSQNMNLVPAFQTVFRDLLQTSFQLPPNNNANDNEDDQDVTSAIKNNTTSTTNNTSTRIDVAATIHTLTTQLNDASILADRVSAQVRALDIQRARVSSALTSTSEVLHTRSCAANVERALQRQDVRSAAEQVARFRKAIRGPVADLVNAKQILLVEQAAKDVSIQVKEELQKSLQNPSRPNLTNILKTFGYLGIDSYKYGLSEIVNSTLEKLKTQCNVNQMESNQNQIEGSRNQGVLLSRLLNSTSEVMARELKVIDAALTETWLKDTLDQQEMEDKEDRGDKEDRENESCPVVNVMLRLHEGCSVIASKLLMQFSIDSGLNKSITENVAFWTQEDAGKNQHILNEAAVLCQRCESYLRWFSSQKNHIFTSMQLKFKNIVMKNTNPKKRIYNKATKQHPKFKQKEDDEDDGNLDGVQQRNVLLETKWLEQSLSEMSRIQLASGDLSISMQELAATYVALEDRVLQFGITSALNSDTPSMYSTSVSARYYSQLMGKSTTSQSSESNTDNSKQSSESDAAVGATSSIEETFSLLQHAMTRAMRSGMIDLACAAVNVSVTMLENTIIHNLESIHVVDDGKKFKRAREKELIKLNRDHTSSSTRSSDSKGIGSEFENNVLQNDNRNRHLQSSNSGEIDSIAIHVAEEMGRNTLSTTSTINNLFACSVYCRRLHVIMSSEASADFSKSSLPKINMVLDGILNCSRQCSKSVEKMIDSLYRDMRHRIVSRLDTMNGQSSTVRYLLNEKEYDQVKLIDPFQVEIVDGLRSILLPYFLTLCRSGFHVLIHKIMSIVTVETFARASRRQFTHLGGIKFDNDVRSLQKLFSNLLQTETSSSSLSVLEEKTKDRFDRLKRMAYILSMEELDDVTESWNEGAILNLTVGEVKKIACMRIDFENETVGVMKLR